MRGIPRLGLATVLISMATLVLGYAGETAYAADIDDSADCDDVAIIYCGSTNEDEFHDKWNDDGRYSDHARVYESFGIQKDDVSGMVDGVVWRDGRVTLSDGTLVATGATTAGRNYGGTSISGTDSAAKFPTSKFVNEGQTAMIKMVDGKFKFAVLKSCGNPVTANPVYNKPAPKPPVVVQPKEIDVCDLKTQQIITIKESDFISTKHSKDSEDCEKEITVCELKTKDEIIINEQDFDSELHSKDFSDCEAPIVPEPPKPAAPPALPVTGTAQDIMAIFGATSLAGAATAYHLSRRQS